MSKQAKGILLVAVSAVLFGVTPVFGRLSYEGGSNAYMLTFFRSFFALPILAAMAFAQKRSLRLPAKQMAQMFLLSLFGSSVTAASLYGSYSYIPVGVATALHFSYPALVVVMAAVLQKRWLTPPQILVLVLSVAGVALFCDLEGGVSALGVIMALVSAVSFAFYILFQAQTGLAKLDSTVFCLYQALFVSGIMLVFNLLFGSFTLALTPGAYGYTLLVAILVAVVAFACLQRGIAMVGPSTAAIFSLLEPITSIVVSVAVLGEGMEWKKALGCVLILSGVVVQAVFPARVKPREAQSGKEGGQ